MSYNNDLIRVVGDGWVNTAPLVRVVCWVLLAQQARPMAKLYRTVELSGVWERAPCGVSLSLRSYADGT